jgi:hypothetical protein
MTPSQPHQGKVRAMEVLFLTRLKDSMALMIRGRTTARMKRV